MFIFDFIYHLGFIKLFLIVFSIQCITFWIASRFRNDRKWHKAFYQTVEVFVDSPTSSEHVWSYLTNQTKLMKFNLNNRLGWIKFDQPLQLNSKVKVKVRRGSILRGFITDFKPLQKLRFEYFAFPSPTRYIWEIEMINIGDKNRYILRVKVKKLLIPLLNKLFPKLTGRMEKMLLNVLNNCIKTCEQTFSSEDLNFKQPWRSKEEKKGFVENINNEG